jgi:hypothetical protein
VPGWAATISAVTTFDTVEKSREISGATSWESWVGDGVVMSEAGWHADSSMNRAATNRKRRLLDDLRAFIV